MALDENEQRLWNIDSSKPDGAPLWPIITLVFVCSFLALTLTIPCIGMRMQYLVYGDSKMSIWQMVCEDEPGGCVCRTGGADSIQGTAVCELRNDMRARCRQPQAGDYDSFR